MYKISVSYNNIVYWFRQKQQRFDECLYHAISTVKRTNKCVNYAHLQDFSVLQPHSVLI